MTTITDFPTASKIAECFRVIDSLGEKDAVSVYTALLHKVGATAYVEGLEVHSAFTRSLGYSYGKRCPLCARAVSEESVQCWLIHRSRCDLDVMFVCDACDHAIVTDTDDVLLGSYAQR